LKINVKVITVEGYPYETSKVRRTEKPLQFGNNFFRRIAMSITTSHDNKLDLLKSIEIFKLLSEENLANLASECKEITIDFGEVLFREGDVGETMYVVLSGEIYIEKENTVIALRERGEYIGEMTLIEDKPRTATAKAVKETRLLEIHKEQFLAHLASNSQALMSFLKTGSERSRENLNALDQGMKILKAQKKRNSNLSDLLDDTVNEIYIFDMEFYHFIDLNSRAIKNLGYQSNEITKITPFDVISDMTKESFEELVQPLLSDNAEEIIYIGRHRRKDGSSYPVEICFKMQKNATPPVIIGMAQDISKIKELENINDSLIFFDHLTGLPNKQQISDELNSELLRAIMSKKSVAVLLMDLDNFKTINDSLGHSAGDTLLKAVTKRLKEWSSQKYLLGRYGGDEFIVILSDIENEAQTEKTASSLLKLFNEPFKINGQTAHVSLSLGISHYPMDGKDSRALIKNADTAMYVAKSNGKNQYCNYNSSMETQAKNDLTLEEDLWKALERNEFVLYYQP
jgi:diguanylate cyclase (GGDEF)-like protein/PAS domain S-box-containing protein